MAISGGETRTATQPPRGVTPRIDRLRQRLLATPAEITPERALLVTEAYRESEAEPMLVRRAKALDRILRRTTIFILEDELIVGHLGERYHCAPVHPEVNVGILDEEELNSFEVRKQNRLLVSAETKAVLRDLAQYWRGKTLLDRSWAALPESVRRMRQYGGMTLAHEKNMLGHCLPDWAKLLHLGWGGLRAEVEAALDGLRLAEPEDLAKWDFLRALRIVVDAASAFAGRYAGLAAELGEREAQPARAAELREIATVCGRLAEQPPRTFREALQLLWFGHLITVIEGDARSTSFGRADQYLLPFYRADIASGALTPAQAQELLECFWIKPNEMVLLDDRDHATYRGGYPNGWNLVVGGVTRDGADATNELSHMCLQAFEDVRLFQPNFGVRTHPAAPQAFLHRAWEVIALGTGVPQVFNDPVIVDALVRGGLPLEEARDYAPTGCVEHATPATWIRGNGGWINLGKAVEFALTDGRCAFSRELVGLRTGDPTLFATYAAFEAAVKTQLAYQIEQMVIENNIVDGIHAGLVPELLISLLIQDCVAAGKSAAAGGARYNYTSPMSIGVATLGDSLAAVKKLVFDERKLTLAELVAALAVDFEGQEPLRQLLLNRAPKYGNDDDYVDEIVVGMQRFFAAELAKYRSPRGGTFRPGYWTVLANMGLGRLTGATPNGRKAREALSDSIGPTNGCDRADTTAVLCSAGKIDQRAAGNGTVLNLRLSPSVLAGEGGVARLGQLVESYFEMGGSQLAVMVVSTETLRAAQRHPERHRDLLVKVAGYAAFFVELGEPAQNEIIYRSEHGA